uniref:Large ribosomal subunit protein mL49 n=1 Tax=Maylandia zebra TaxID=106582 RepID=A0A3P9D306_9CICH
MSPLSEAIRRSFVTFTKAVSVLFNILPRVKSSGVERLIPPSRIPTLPKHTGPTPSGWISRHDILIYTDVTNSNQKLTLIWKREGDIRALEKDVRQYLKEVMGKELLTQANVITMTDWLVSKGF